MSWTWRKKRDYSNEQIISRDDAISAGLKQYFTGEPCAAGHVAPRYTRAHAIGRTSGPCVICAAEASLASMKKRFGGDIEKQRVYRRENRISKPVESLLRCAKARAKRKGYDFLITISDISISEFCPCCGQKMQMRTGERKTGPTPQSPSLDRINSSFGYVPGNVAVICWRCNELKRNATVEELRNILKWMETGKRKSVVRLAG